MIPVSSITSPLIQEFISFKSSTLFNNNLILIESHKIIFKAVHCNLKIKKLLTSESLFKENKDLFDHADEIFCLPDNQINNLVGQSFHGGVMAICERPEVDNLKKDETILVLNGVTSPENIGAIIRSAAGFNITNILLDSKSCHPHVKRAIRVSMGNVFFCQIESSNNLPNRLKQFQDDGYDLISFANQKGAKKLNEFKFKKKSCLVVGSEGHGIEEAILSQSNQIIKIEMNDEVQHFNAACATSIFLYAFSNQSS